MRQPKNEQHCGSPQEERRKANVSRSSTSCLHGCSPPKQERQDRVRLAFKEKENRYTDHSARSQRAPARRIIAESSIRGHILDQDSQESQPS
jgi:hypothetical protein